MKALALAVMLLLASGAARAESGMPGEPAFVEHRLTLQLSDGGEDKQRLVLSVAFNVLKVYGADKVAIDIVAFGPGIELLREGNPNAEQISSLAAQGVLFDACTNTIETIERRTGKPFPLDPHARRVTAGVVQIIDLAEHGYTTVRP